MKHKFTILLMLSVFGLSGLVQAQIPYTFINQSGPYVSVNGSDILGDGTINNPYQTIQYGITEVSSGQSVNVMPGTYTGFGNTNLSLQGKSIVLQSTNGPENTIIDGLNTTNGFLLNSGETVSSIIRGFTIQNCIPKTKNGSAIFVDDNSGVSIRCCLFKLNQVNNEGNGSVIQFGDTETSGPQSSIDSCIFYKNNSMLVNSSKKSWYIRYCLFEKNTCTSSFIGNAHDAGDDQDISNSVFRDNNAKHNIVRIDHAKTLSESFFINNTSQDRGLIYMGTVWSGTNLVDHCTFYNNSATLYNSNTYDHVGQVTNSVFFGASGYETISGKHASMPFSYSNGSLPYNTGNTTGDPLFVDPVQNDFNYQDGSTCINSSSSGNNQGAKSNNIPAWLWAYSDECSDTTITIYSTICKGSSVLSGGIERIETGQYIDSLTTAIGGCDSVIVLNLTINPNYNVYDTTIYYVSSNDYNGQLDVVFDQTETLSSLTTCDSVVNKYKKFEYNPNHCSVNDTTVVIINDTVWANESIYDTTYISVDDTLKINFMVTDIQNNPIGQISTFKVYPNPTINQLNVEIENSSYVNGYTLDIYTIGGILKESKTINSAKITFDLIDYATGTYMLYLMRNGNIMETKKIIIQ